MSLKTGATSATAIRAQVRREEATKKKAKKAEKGGGGGGGKRGGGEDDDDDDDDGGGGGDHLDDLNEDQLSAFNPVVIARKRSEAYDETSGRFTPLELALSRLRRFKPPKPQSVQPKGVYWFLLYFGVSMSIRRERKRHDAERRRRANDMLELLLDAALGKGGDGGGGCFYTKHSRSPHTHTLYNVLNSSPFQASHHHCMNNCKTHPV